MADSGVFYRLPGLLFFDSKPGPVWNKVPRGRGTRGQREQGTLEVEGARLEQGTLEVGRAP